RALFSRKGKHTLKGRWAGIDKSIPYHKPKACGSINSKRDTDCRVALLNAKTLHCPDRTFRFSVGKATLKGGGLGIDN
ncbi:MAG: hypothetical protein IJN83_08770, partial [Clostridia bacterium]|nr:hypothetical protein [Clostridia bacterium]